MPSLDKLFSMMKNLPPQAVAQDLNNPDPNKKLAAMMVANNDQKIQQQSQVQRPMPTVLQKLTQTITPQATPQPTPQGIAALQPPQNPAGSAMNGLPIQVSPTTQGAPMKQGGIAKFAQGGATQDPQKQAQALAQLMQAINQNANATIPQQAQQTGIAPPQPGQAMPLQNYATFQFATRPQVRPGTEAAPISSDLSLSQLGQYSPEQPIAAAHGGIMHHVPGHMYKFAPGGIIGFEGKEGSSVKGANISQDQIDAVLADLTGNPGINPGNNSANAAANAGNTYTPITLPQFSQQAPVAQQAPASQQAPVVSQGINIDPNAINASAQALTQNPGVNPSNALAQAAQGAGNTYTPLNTGVQLQNLDTGVQPKVRGNVPSPFQGIYDAVGNFFSNQGTTATNPKLGGTRSTPNPPAANQTSAQPNPITQKNQQLQNQSGPLDLSSPSQPPAPNIKPPVGGYYTPPSSGIAALKNPYATEDATAISTFNDELKAPVKLKDHIDNVKAINKEFGLDTPAGSIALNHLQKIEAERNKNEKANEVNDLIRVMRGWGQGGPGGAADVYTGLQRQHQLENENFLWNQLKIMDEVDQRNREEKIKNGQDVGKTFAEAQKERSERINKAAELARTAANDKARNETQFEITRQQQLGENARTNATIAASNWRTQLEHGSKKSDADLIADWHKIPGNEKKPDFEGFKEIEAIRTGNRAATAEEKNAIARLGLLEKDTDYSMARHKAYFEKDPTKRAQAQALVKEIESKAGITQPTTSSLVMPNADKLAAYAKEHYGGDVEKARQFLASQGYK